MLDLLINEPTRLTIEFEHNAKFFFFFYKKKYYKLVIEFKEATFAEFLKFTQDMEQKVPLERWLFNFIQNHQILQKKQKPITWQLFESFFLDKEGFQKVFELVTSRFLRGTKLAEKFKNYNVDKHSGESCDSMFLAFFLTNTSETVHSLLNMTYSQILMIRDGVALVNRGQTKEGQKKNDFIIRRRRAEEVAANLTEEEKEAQKELIKKDRQEALNKAFQEGKFTKNK